MADKKPKVSFKGGTPARSSTPAADKETVLVDVGGEATPVYRGKGAARLDDAVWARVKARVLPSEGDNKSLKDQPLDWPRLMQMGQNLDQVADSVVSKDQKELLGKISEWDRAEYLRQRFRNKGYDVPLESAQEFRKTLQKEPTATDVGVTKPAQGSPDEWKAPPEKATVVPSTVEWDNQKPAPSSAGRTEDDAMVGMGGSMRNPASFVPQMALGATGATGSPTLDAVGARAGEVADTMSNAAAQGKSAQDAASPVNMVKEQVDQRVFGDKPLIPDAVKQLPQAIGAGAATDVGSLLQWTGQAAGMPNMAKAGANLSAGAVMPPAYGGPPREPMAPVPGAKPAPGELPAQQQMDPTQQGGGGSLAMSLTGQMPAGFKVAGVDPEVLKAEHEAVKQAGVDSAAVRETVKQVSMDQQFALAESMKLQRDKLATAETLAAEAAQARREHVVQAEKFENARMGVLEQARKAAATPTDPNRYWNNKTAGQQAAAVIAGALFGFTGQGMNWLGRIDALVAEDNRLQQSDRAAKVQGLNAEAQGLGEAAQAAMARGASLAQAKLIEKAAKYESVKAYADQFGVQTQNAQVQMQAAQVSATLGAKIADLAQQGHQLASMDAAHTNSARAANANLAQDRFKTAATIAAKSAGTGGLKFSPGEVGRMDAAQQGLDAVKTLKGMLGPESSFPKAIYDEVTKRGGQLTDAGRRQKGVEPQRRAIIRLIDASAIQKADAEYWKDKISNVGLDNMSQADLDGLTKFFASQHDAVVRVRQGLGSYTGSETAADFPEQAVE